MNEVKALLFDVFGTVVALRRSVAAGSLLFERGDALFIERWRQATQLDRLLLLIGHWRRATLCPRAGRCNEQRRNNQPTAESRTHGASLSALPYCGLLAGLSLHGQHFTLKLRDLPR
jgi:hypothetical protein